MAGQDPHADDWIETLRKTKGADLYASVESTNWMDIQMSWKETCYIGKWDFMPDLHVSGPDALDLFSDLSVNTFENFPIGKAKQLVMCSNDGKVIGDGVIMRVGEDEFQYQNVASWTKYHAETGDYDVDAEIRDSFLYQIQGPNALKVLQKVTDTDLTEIDFMHFDDVEIAGRTVQCLRQGMSGEIGFELHGPREWGQEIFDLILEEGQEYGIRHLVGRTRIINHLESSFPTAGIHYLPAIYDDDLADYREWAVNFDEGRDWAPWQNFNWGYAIEGSFDGDDISDWYVTPVELGWERNIKFDHDFIGREALEEEVETPSRSIVTLEWDDDDVAEVFESILHPGDHYKFMELPYTPVRTVAADEVLKDGERIGYTSGRGYSYYFRQMISLAVIDIEQSEPGTEVTVVWGEGKEPLSQSVQPHVPKEISATVANAPYKEDRRRGDLKAYADD